jgi:hypothetical protein
VSGRVGVVGDDAPRLREGVGWVGVCAATPQPSPFPCAARGLLPLLVPCVIDEAVSRMPAPAYAALTTERRTLNEIDVSK